MNTKPNLASRIKLIVLFVFACLLISAYWKGETFAKKNDPQVNPTPEKTQKAEARPAAPPSKAIPIAAAPVAPIADDAKTEGCVKCHNNIEPMHRYNAKGDVFDKLDDGGKDARG